MVLQLERARGPGYKVRIAQRQGSWFANNPVSISRGRSWRSYNVSWKALLGRVASIFDVD